jgi:hypothetical protein
MQLLNSQNSLLLLSSAYGSYNAEQINNLQLTINDFLEIVETTTNENKELIKGLINKFKELLDKIDHHELITETDANDIKQLLMRIIRDLRPNDLVKILQNIPFTQIVPMFQRLILGDNNPLVLENLENRVEELLGGRNKTKNKKHKKYNSRHKTHNKKKHNNKKQSSKKHNSKKQSSKKHNSKKHKK